MILPEGHEEMTDEELVERLVADEIYDRDEAEAIVAVLRSGEAEIVPE